MEGLAGIRIPTDTLDETCDIHPDVHLIKFKNHKPFCPVCQQLKMEQERRNHDRKIVTDSIKNTFYKASLIGNVRDYKKTFDNYSATKGSQEAKVGNQAYKIATEYIKYPDKEMTTILSGQPGEGKTHLAMAIANKVVSESEPPQRVLFVDANKLYSHIKNSWNDPNESWTQFESVKRMSEVDLLILDDLGSESNMKGDSKASETMQGVLKELLDSQYRLIFTTNLTYNELKQTYNPKLVSRLFANSKGRRLDFTGIQDKRMIS